LNLNASSLSAEVASTKIVEPVRPPDNNNTTTVQRQVADQYRQGTSIKDGVGYRNCCYSIIGSRCR
jgi:hypothetical protein